MGKSSKELKAAKRIEKWRQTRKMGKVRFLLVYGSIFWGIPTGVISSLVTTLNGDTGSSLLLLLAINIPIFFLTGALWGYLMWCWFEASYKKELAKVKEVPDNS